MWVVRPDGRDARRVAGVRSGTANFGPWLRSGAVLPLSTSGRRPEETSSTLLDVHTGLSRRARLRRSLHGARPAPRRRRRLVRVGGRGRRTVLEVDLRSGTVRNLIAPDVRRRRASPIRVSSCLTAGCSLRSNLRRDRYALMLLGPAEGAAVQGVREVIAVHPGGELDSFAVTNDGEWAALLWNVRGCSVLEVMHLPTGRRRRVAGGPDVDRPGALQRRRQPARRLRAGTATPARALWHCDPRQRTLMLEPSTGRGRTRCRTGSDLVTPTRETFIADDGLTIEGWLYRPPGTTGPVPTVIHLHGGPEAQERLGLCAALPGASRRAASPSSRPTCAARPATAARSSMPTTAPLRFDAISDVAACALHLLRTGIASPGQLACMGRSYGGYLTLAALTFHPELFAAGVDVCGMSDLQTFYADTEPWVAAVATPKYGDPRHRRRACSPSSRRCAAFTGCALRCSSFTG